MALSPSAVRRANARLWAAHPELNGRLLTTADADGSLRREWMKLYAEEKGVGQTNQLPLGAPPGSPAGAAVPLTTANPPAITAPQPVMECKQICKDESNRECPCSKLTTITIYVQDGDSPTDIVGSFIGSKAKGGWWDAQDAVGKADGDRPGFQPETGHTFIAIGDGELGNQRAYGFYPVSSWFGGTGGINTNAGFYVPGEKSPRQDIYPPENRHSHSHSRSFKACPDAVTALESSIQRDIAAIQANSPEAPSYNLAFLQCTTWAQGHLAEVGFSPPGGHSPHGAAGEIDEEHKAQE